ncbi:hypothetical protein GGX14DRAFT_408832 [Mycena pura]|uniref:Uncharacterized protein n=1 Tax=Mycena pura TaxID=153505 RepID=A0AAD6UKZ9_9AGAR|nr:hypothetical protein GGX14DRAFT_408832 [Mycena pura]
MDGNNNPAAACHPDALPMSPVAEHIENDESTIIPTCINMKVVLIHLPLGSSHDAVLPSEGHPRQSSPGPRRMRPQQTDHTPLQRQLQRPTSSWRPEPSMPIPAVPNAVPPPITMKIADGEAPSPKTILKATSYSAIHLVTKDAAQEQRDV